MPITRTPIVDDDGSGKTGTVLNNSWKQELYGQIDAFVPPVYGTWTPTDQSGAGLVMTGGGNGNYAKWGKLLYVQIQLVFPSTANSAQALVGGLPFTASAHCGLYQSYGGPQVRCWISLGGSTLTFLTPTTGAPMTNAQLTGANFVVSGVIQTTT